MKIRVRSRLQRVTETIPSHLEADVEDNLVRVPSDRDDREQVDERQPTLAVIDEARLALLALRDLSLDVRNGDVVCVLSA